MAIIRPRKRQDSVLVTHKQKWVPADLPINAAGDTRPGFICVHELENGNGPCGGNVFELTDAGDDACVTWYSKGWYARLRRMHTKYHHRRK